MIQNSPREHVDRLIIGAGIFGLYAALMSAKKGYTVRVLEKANAPFQKASHRNQARIHRGYHYPRSLATALGTLEYVERFITDFDFAVDRNLEQIYAIAQQFSYTDPGEYEKFCRHAGIPLEPISTDTYFNTSTIAAAYRTAEYTFDATRMYAFLSTELEKYPNVTIECNTTVVSVEREATQHRCVLSTGKSLETSFVINATYAGLNDVIQTFGYEPIKIKYEFAELALCRVSERISHVGLTVMDGPFFSLMPFGMTGLHTLSSVTYTPHITRNTPEDMDAYVPTTRFNEMYQLAQKYLSPDITLTYDSSLYATKTILTKTEVDDARPTLLHTHATEPYFVSIMSGKINTIFDIDAII
jgi:2-polyprenyl-6-methoxyphenol hydroxylase-like FAD-dependent oxidoreductase